MVARLRGRRGSQARLFGDEALECALGTAPESDCGSIPRCLPSENSSGQGLGALLSPALLADLRFVGLGWKYNNRFLRKRSRSSHPCLGVACFTGRVSLAEIGPAMQERARGTPVRACVCSRGHQPLAYQEAAPEDPPGAPQGCLYWRVASCACGLLRGPGWAERLPSPNGAQQEGVSQVRGGGGRGRGGMPLTTPQWVGCMAPKGAEMPPPGLGQRPRPDGCGHTAGPGGHLPSPQCHAVSS